MTVAALSHNSSPDRLSRSHITPPRIVRYIDIAKNLIEGKTIEEIRSRLRVGLSTIQSVDRWLERGFGDYRTRLPAAVAHGRRAKHRAPEVARDIKGTFTDLRRRHRGHFLLLNWILDSKL